MKAFSSLLGGGSSSKKKARATTGKELGLDEDPVLLGGTTLVNFDPNGSRAQPRASGGKQRRRPHQGGFTPRGDVDSGVTHSEQPSFPPPSANVVPPLTPSSSASTTSSSTSAVSRSMSALLSTTSASALSSRGTPLTSPDSSPWSRQPSLPLSVGAASATSVSADDVPSEYEYEIVYNRNESEPGLFESPRAAPSAPSYVPHVPTPSAGATFSSSFLRKSLSPKKQAIMPSKMSVQTDVEQIPTLVESIAESDVSSVRSPVDVFMMQADSAKRTPKSAYKPNIARRAVSVLMSPRDDSKRKSIKKNSLVPPVPSVCVQSISTDASSSDWEPYAASSAAPSVRSGISGRLTPLDEAVATEPGSGFEGTTPKPTVPFLDTVPPSKNGLSSPSSTRRTFHSIWHSKSSRSLKEKSKEMEKSEKGKKEGPNMAILPSAVLPNEVTTTGSSGGAPRNEESKPVRRQRAQSVGAPKTSASVEMIKELSKTVPVPELPLNARMPAAEWQIGPAGPEAGKSFFDAFEDDEQVTPGKLALASSMSTPTKSISPSFPYLGHPLIPLSFKSTSTPTYLQQSLSSFASPSRDSQRTPSKTPRSASQPSGTSSMCSSVELNPPLSASSAISIFSAQHPLRPRESHQSLILRDAILSIQQQHEEKPINVFTPPRHPGQIRRQTSTSSLQSSLSAKRSVPELEGVWKGFLMEVEEDLAGIMEEQQKSSVEAAKAWRESKHLGGLPAQKPPPIRALPAVPIKQVQKQVQEHAPMQQLPMIRVNALETSNLRRLPPPPDTPSSDERVALGEIPEERLRRPRPSSTCTTSSSQTLTAGSTGHMDIKSAIRVPAPLNLSTSSRSRSSVREDDVVVYGRTLPTVGNGVMLDLTRNSSRVDSVFSLSQFPAPPSFVHHHKSGAKTSTDSHPGNRVKDHATRTPPHSAASGYSFVIPDRSHQNSLPPLSAKSSSTKYHSRSTSSASSVYSTAESSFSYESGRRSSLATTASKDAPSPSSRYCLGLEYTKDPPSLPSPPETSSCPSPPLNVDVSGEERLLDLELPKTPRTRHSTSASAVTPLPSLTRLPTNRLRGHTISRIVMPSVTCDSSNAGRAPGVKIHSTDSRYEP